MNENEEKLKKFTSVRRICFLLLLGLIILIPVWVSADNVPVPVIDRTNTIFLDESGLDLTNALTDPITNTICDTIGFWEPGTNITNSAASFKVNITAGERVNFRVDSLKFTNPNDGYVKTGPYYLCNLDGMVRKDNDGKPLKSIDLAVPYITLVPVDNICPEVNRTGEIFLGTNVNFKILTNLNLIQSRPNVPRNANRLQIFDINLTGVNGRQYSQLLGPEPVPSACTCPIQQRCQQNNPTIALKRIQLPADNVWRSWQTNALDPTTRMLDTPEGIYSISITCNANNLNTNNVQTGIATSAIAQIDLVDEYVNVEVNPGSFLRTEQTTASIKGKPKTEYIIGIIECPLKMTGAICDRPPYFKNDTLNLSPYNITFDPEGGPYPIGNTAVYPSCCDNLTFREVVPHVFHDGVLYYASITTDCFGNASITIQADNTVWKADNNATYTVHIQKRARECSGLFIYDDALVTVEKGIVSIQISQASDKTNTPITMAYLGDTLKIAGANTDSNNTYLYMIGPCQPECGGGLIPVPYPHGLIGPGPEIVPVLQPPEEGFDWIFINPGAGGIPRFWETRYLPVNPGNYTIYAISNWPPSCPVCLDCNGKTCSLNAGCSQRNCPGNVCSFTNCPNCDVYAVTTIQLKAPELKAETQDIERCCCPGYPCGNTYDTHPINVSGTSFGNPEKELNVWMFGRGKIGDHKFINTKIKVNCDGTFSFDVVKDLLKNIIDTPLCRIDAGVYNIIIQDPGYNHQYDVIYESDLDRSIWADPVEVNKRWILIGFPDVGPMHNETPFYDSGYSPADYQVFYSDDWRRLVQVEGPGYKLGTEVLNAVIRGLEDPNVDDNYVHLKFIVKDKSCLAGTDFTADRTYGNNPLTVRFTDKSFNASSWLWDFGDSTNTSTEKNPVHTYTVDGRYTVSLTTNGDDKSKQVKNDYIRVAKGPTARFSYTPDYIWIGDKVQFMDLSVGNPTTWKWDFGDSTSSPLESPEHIYSTKGNYTVNLTVSDDIGISQSTSEVVIVDGPIPPTPTPTPTPSIYADFITTSLNRTTVNFADNSVGYPNKTESVWAWVWNVGDGTAYTGETFDHTYQKEGTYSVSMTVTNGKVTNTTTKNIGIR